MIKKMIAAVLALSMLFGMTISVFAENSNENGIASGITTLTPEIEYTTAYTLTIPASISDMNLSQDAETTVGEVKVTKQNDNAEFDPSKRVSVIVEYDGKLINSEDSNKEVAYKLLQKKGESEATDLENDTKLFFSASEIEAKESYMLNALVTQTNKSGGTYSGTVRFTACVEDAKISFTVICSQGTDKENDDITYVYEVNPGTTWGEFVDSGAVYRLYVNTNDSNTDRVTCRVCEDESSGWVKEDMDNYRRAVSLSDEIKNNGRYWG